jgi:hypothetical protein
MPTRFYLPSTGTPPVSLPGLPAGWTAGDVPELELNAPATKSNTALTDYSVGETTTSVINIPIAAFISPPLQAQTISGTFSAVVRGLESNAGADDSLQIGIVLIDNLGTTIKSVLYAGHAAALNTTVGALGQEFTTAAQTRRFNAVALTSQTAILGDRLAIIVGYRSHDTTSTNRNTTLRFGDPTAVADFANTAGLTTDLCPWVELSGTITFQTLTAVSDTFQTSWNVLSQVSDAWQTSWNIRKEIVDSWQTSWDVFIRWQDIAGTTWESHSTETWGTLAQGLTAVSKTWQTSWNVRGQITDSWQTSWGVNAQVSDSWQTSWNVRATISDAWQTSWNVRGAITDAWQTSWNVRQSITDAWQTSWNVRGAIQDSWTTSWNVEANIPLTTVSDTWLTSWNVRSIVSDSWATSWRILKEISDSWQTSWGVGGTVSNSWSTSWNVQSLVTWNILDSLVATWTESGAAASVYTKLNTSANTWTPVDSPVGAFDEVDKPTTIWSE